MTKKEPTTKKKSPKEQETIKEKTLSQSDLNQATTNALQSVMELTTDHQNRMNNLESKLETIMGKLGQVLTRMGL